MQYRVFKQFIDFIVSLIGLIILSPVLLLLTIILTFQNRGSAFFLQPRPGKNEKIFKVIKFKTMNDKRDNEGNLLPSELRITKMGRIIRNFSLDELLQLVNVIKGDMSIIGPRPLRIEYLPLYSDFENRRHEVKPGITGWAQVNGRNSLSWEERFNLDVWYVDHISSRLDLKIICLTIQRVLSRKDINTKQEKLMEPFKGIKLNG